MLATDVGFVVYFTVTGLGLIPLEWAFADYTNPLMVDWNWSFLWIDLLAGATGLTSLWLLRRDQASGADLIRCLGASAVTAGTMHKPALKPVARNSWEIAVGVTALARRATDPTADALILVRS
ncbi:DUF5360 family protein [Nonomuraea sp. NPDC049419]|uniref:DUF5360 family protein n=1 Tax=Nonomuraea sp. NPDC049419 TaxID=3155772 RepID=UPI0034487249